MLEKYKQVIDEDFTKDVDFIDKTIKNLNLDKNSKILDIGTGLGAMSILLAMNGFSVLTGQLEKDPEWEDKKHGKHDHAALFNWEKNAKALEVENKITFQHLNAESLHFPDDSFDSIFMYDTLQHITNRERALNECIRVMKLRGLICIVEWNKKSIAETEETYGFTIDYIDPRKILNRKDVSIELIAGEFVNIFVITCATL